MGAVALALSRAGWSVTGSDEGAYPPMSELLKEHGIEVMMPYDSANIPCMAELLVVGKRVGTVIPNFCTRLRTDYRTARFRRCCAAFF